MRISTEGLEKKRRRLGSSILVTGGTGFLGSHLAARLLQDGFEITVLARAAPRLAAPERVRRIMDWHGIPAEAQARVRVVAGDLLDPELGMDAGERSRLLADTDEIIHCASETSFAERKRAYIEEVNVCAVERLLDFAAAGRCAAFHYLSTAYVAGQAEGVCEETLSVAREFHNPYEETKRRAEAMVWERCAAAGIRPVIYRPSVVYGHSVTGRSLSFNAVYHPVRAAIFLRDIYLKDIYKRRGERARAAGVRLEPGGLLHMPLRVGAEGPGIDLVPVDFFVDAFAAIFASALEGGIFHIVNGRPTPVAEIAAYTSRMFGLSGVEAVSPADLNGFPRNQIEAAYDQMIAVYRPYMSDRRAFSIRKSGPILSRAGLACPAFTYGIFQRCVNYAVATGWGTAEVLSQP